MHIQFFLPIFALLTSSIAVAVVANDAANMTSATPSANVPDNFRCFYPDPGFDPRAPVKDCMQAILNLPQVSERDTFQRWGRGGRGGDFKLPLQRIKGGCSVTVDSKSGDDISSWPQLSNVAMQLVFGCGEATTGKAGGVQDTGDNNRLRVTVGAAGASDATTEETSK